MQNPKQYKSVVSIVKEVERAQRFLINARALYNHHNAWKRSECGIAAAKDANAYMEATKIALQHSLYLLEESKIERQQ